MYTSYSWKGEPIYDIRKWAKEEKQPLLIVKRMEVVKAPKYTQDERPDLWEMSDCPCCGGEMYYVGPTVKKTETSVFEVPKVFWDNQRYSPYEENITYKVIEEWIPE